MAMTAEATTLGTERQSIFATAMAGQVGPVALVLLAIVAIWYAGAVYMNAPWEIDRFEKKNIDWSAGDLVRATMKQERPILPAPHQVLVELNRTICQ